MEERREPGRAVIRYGAVTGKQGRICVAIGEDRPNERGLTHTVGFEYGSNHFPRRGSDRLLMFGVPIVDQLAEQPYHLSLSGRDRTLIGQRVDRLAIRVGLCLRHNHPRLKGQKKLRVLGKVSTYT